MIAHWTAELALKSTQCPQALYRKNAFSTRDLVKAVNKIPVAKEDIPLAYIDDILVSSTLLEKYTNQLEAGQSLAMLNFYKVHGEISSSRGTT